MSNPIDLSDYTFAVEIEAYNSDTQEWDTRQMPTGDGQVGLDLAVWLRDMAEQGMESETSRNPHIVYANKVVWFDWTDGDD